MCVYVERVQNSPKVRLYMSSPGTDFSHIRLSPEYILRCNADWNVIENGITKPKDFPRETKKKKKKKKKRKIERQVGFSSLQSGRQYNFGVTVETSSSSTMKVHDFGK